MPTTKLLKDMGETSEVYMMDFIYCLLGYLKYITPHFLLSLFEDVRST